MKERSRSRGWAVQALYAWETRSGETDMLVPIMESLPISQRNLFYTSVLVRVVARNIEEIDRTIARNLENWSFERLSVIDRNVLRVGVAELRFLDDVPPAITIQEMVRIAERFGTPDSPRFVNGVLDAVFHEVQKGGAAERT